MDGPRGMTVGLEELPSNVRTAFVRLRDGLLEVNGLELVSLWAYGAATRPDRPRCLGDLDTHGILRAQPHPATIAAVDALQDALAAEAGVVWDSWYILIDEARGVRPPHHAFRRHLADGLWSLHRAHWLAGEHILLHGQRPEELVSTPTWSELVVGLQQALVDIECATEDDDEPRKRLLAYVVANACRIVYSVEHRNVVVSKRAAAVWGATTLPEAWRPAIHAAMRVYDGEDAPMDCDLIAAALPAMVEAARRELSGCLREQER